MTPVYFLTVQRDVPSGPLEWLLGASNKPCLWAFLVGCVETIDGKQRTSVVGYGTGYASLVAAFEAGEPVLARRERGDLPLPTARDEEALRLQIQANGRDPHCAGCY